MAEDITPSHLSAADDDLLFTIAHALRYQGRRPVSDADRLTARIAAERILQELRKGYEIKPRRPTPLATIDQHPKMRG
jgi:hypothetical protein